MQKKKLSQAFSQPNFSIIDIPVSVKYSYLPLEIESLHFILIMMLTLSSILQGLLNRGLQINVF